MSVQPERVLILYVDRDGDVTKFTKIPTPIIGREKNLEAANSFALLSPEDSDLNALFYAIKLYDELVSKKLFSECQIATVSGVEGVGIESDVRIKEELKKVLSVFKADGVIFISDGGRDELVIPIVSSMIPIISIKRVIVGQSEGVEETFLLVIKYIKNILVTPSLRYLTIGIPGVLLMFYALLSFFNLSHFFSLMFLLFIGIIAFIKGFYIDELIIKSITNYKLQSFSFIISTIIVSLAAYNAVIYANSISSSNPDLGILHIFAIFLVAPFAYYLNTVLALTIAGIIFVSARALEHYLDNKPIRQDLLSIFYIFSLGIILTYVANALYSPSFNPQFFGIDVLFLIILLFLLNVLIFVISRFQE